MRHPWKLPLAVVCLLTLALLTLLPARRGSAQAVTYTATDIGTLGGTQSTALGLDECGKVVGESNPTGSTSFHPYLWNGTQMTDLGTFGGLSGGASAVNGGGRVAGYAQTVTSEQRPFIWTQATGTKADLGTPGSGAAAYDINDTNQVVGQWETSPLQDRAFVWTQATGMQIITAPWGTPIAAYGINNAGHIVGTAQTTAGASHAFLSSGGVVTDLGTLGGTNSFAYDLNEADVVVGHANIPSSNASRPFHAFRWTSAGGMQDLGTLGGARSIAYGINASGRIVGYAEISPGVNHAFLWTDDNANGAHDAGEMKDLNTLAPTAGWTYEEARALNDRGQIVVTAINGSNQRRAFLLTPDNAGPSPCVAPGALQFSAAADSVGEAGTSATITVTRTGGSDEAVSVGYATSNGTATAGADYTAASGTLNFANGETSKTFNVAVSDDALDEADETVNLTLSGPAGGATLGTQTTAVLTITDNDASPTLSVGDVTVSEGDTGTVNLVFNVTLSAASAQTVTVGYATSSLGMTATAGTDYTAASGTLTFNPGDTLKTVTVAVVGDTVDEPNETFFLNLSAPSNATFADGQAIGTITDDDGVSSLSIGDVTVTEGNSGQTAATFTVTLLPASGQTVSVNYATADGTANGTVANPSSDYISIANALTFNPGETSKTITVNVRGDITPEAHETFFVNLSSPSNATISDNQGQATVNNDDTALSINDVSAIPEGNSGTTNATFTVTLSHPSINTVSVNYATANDTAVAPGDYTSTSGTLNFAPGETSKTVTVAVVGDVLDEAGEVFLINLSGAVNATITDSQGAGFINDNDAPPSLSAADVSVTEGNSGTTALNFTVTLSAPSGQTVSVLYQTAARTAVAPDDYASVVNTLTFNPGETSKNVTVNVVGDTTPEPHEFFVLALGDSFGNATNATISDQQAEGTINNDDAALSVNDVSHAEGNAGNTAYTFTVSQPQPSVNAVSVNWATANGTATAGSDYTAASGTASIPAGSTSATFTVQVSGDATLEGDENFFVNLSGATNATIADSQGLGTITDDDNAPGFSVNDIQPNEGSGGGTTAFTFTVTLSAPSGLAASVNYATLSAGTATAGSDYTATSGTLNFAPGDTSKTFTVNVNADRIFENDETFSVQLSGATGASITDGQGNATIVNDEATSVVQFSSATYSVSEASPTVTITVTRTGSTAGGVTVGGNTQDGTAVNPQSRPGDFGAGSFQVAFAEGETSKTFTVSIVNDTLDEPDETFSVTFGTFGTFGATFGTPSTATVTITDDDDPPAFQFSAASYSVSENNSDAVIFLKRTGGTNGSPFSGPVSVRLTTSNGTATAGSDYTARDITVSFSEGSGESGPIFIPINRDTLAEADETVNLTLSDPVGGVLGSPSTAVLTIEDNDAPMFGFSQLSFNTDESAHFVTITVTRSGDPSSPVNVDFATSDGTATERKDYTAASGTLRFAAGETSKTFDVLLTEDAFTEPVETIDLKLSNPTGGSALGPNDTAQVFIAADDNPPPAGNPIDNSSDFVRQHYHDFLNREPDADGLAFWVGGIESCGADAACREGKRINTSAAFFLSIEFQETGYFVYRTFKAAYGDATSPGVPGTVPVVRLNEFLPDTRRIGEGVVVGPPGWELTLEANKNAYMTEFVSRQRFTDAYPTTLTPAAFVDALYANAGVTPTAAERQAAIDEFGAAATSSDAAARGRALRRVAEHPALVQAEFRRAFVLMQYYGYLRRNPDDAPEPGLNFGGWNFWLGKLNEFNGDAVRAEMVKAFLDSAEYRNRFGQ